MEDQYTHAWLDCLAGYIGYPKKVPAVIEAARLNSIRWLIRFIQKRKPAVQKIGIDRFAWLRLCDFGGDSDHWSLSQEEKLKRWGRGDARRGSTRRQQTYDPTTIATK
jgi:hypothetical protein